MIQDGHHVQLTSANTNSVNLTDVLYFSATESDSQHIHEV